MPMGGDIKHKEWKTPDEVSGFIGWPEIVATC
jgi:hypothetical protein